MKDEFSFKEYVGMSLFSVGMVLIVGLSSPNFYRDPLSWLIVSVVVIVVAIGIYQKKKKINLEKSQSIENREVAVRIPVLNKVIWVYTTLLMVVMLLLVGPLNKAFSNSREVAVLLSRHEVSRDVVVYYLGSAFVVLVILHLIRIQKLRRK